MSGHGLSKSRLIAWKQCPKRLWLQIHRRDLLEISDHIAQTFEIGFEVGEVARTLYPSGILIEDDDDLSAALNSTRAALITHPELPIFEATFQHDGVLVRADLLLPGASGYRMAEVKASASVKPYHIDDCAIQAWVLQQNKLSLGMIEVMHINTAFVYQGKGDYHGMFTNVNVDDAVFPLLKLVPEWIKEARATLAGEEPNIQPGLQCEDPYECPFKRHCNRHIIQVLEPSYTLDILYRMHAATKDAFHANGIQDALLVPSELLNETQQWIQRVSHAGVPELFPAAKNLLAAMSYPRYYLDFETINLAVPRWEQTRPYASQVPFQWSCHTEEANHHLKHAMFLDVSGNDPRRRCAEQMIKALGYAGPIFVYFQSFEKSRIAELADLYPDLAPALLAINGRIVDLLPITRANYYHPEMKGSWSIKAVLPTIAADLRYDLLTVGNGGDAQVAYREILHPQTPEDRKQELTLGLREYCTLDTLAMVRLAWFLQGIPINKNGSDTSNEITQKN
ncbi:MAG: DUF2779 domain-containing protein [Undibacterium sp.]|nr:DUF2779 domain-containing protein [Undibacterium sp.]